MDRLRPNLLSVCDVMGNRCSPSIHQGNGGARRDRTDDILLAKQALSQLSYGPITETVHLPCGRNGGPG